MIQRALAAVLLTMALACVAPDAVAKGELRLLFAIPENGGKLEAIAAWQNGRYFEPPVGGSDADNNRFLINMKPGASFTATQAGIARGTVTVTKLDSVHMEATVKGKFKARGNMLAVNFKPAKHAPPTTVTEAQKKALTKIAVQKLQDKRVPAEGQKNLQSQFAGRDLDGDGVGEVIATFFAKATAQSRQAHAVIIIAAVQDGYVRPQQVVHQRVKQSDLMSGATMADITPGFLTPLFFDNIDFNGDGKDEVVMRLNSFEGAWYHIWVRDIAGKWDDPYKIYRYRDAF